jgi:effector-binding domain-containing protein
MTTGVDVTVKKREPMVVASVSMKGPYSKIGEAFGKLYGWISEQGFIPAVPPVGVYLNDPKQVPEEELLWELRCPVAGFADPCEPDAEGRSFKQVEEATVAAILHKGPFEEVWLSYDALKGWIANNGYEIVGPAEEAYLAKPDEAQPGETLTEIRFPVQKK